jgi:hypothetical protein
MPYKDPETRKIKNREYGKKYYENNKRVVQDAVNALRRKNRAKWLEYKSTLVCSRCGASHPAIIDFHHPTRDGSKKDVNRLVMDNCFAQAYEEVKRCEVLCANCHRIEHFNEHQAIRAYNRSMRKEDPEDDLEQGP